MVRKTKTAVVQKIESLFETKGTDELPFRTISSELGIAPNRIVGTLSSWPGVFEKTGRVRLGRPHSESEVHTVWRHIPNIPINLDEIREIYQLPLHQMVQLIEPGTENLRWQCWDVGPNEQGKYPRQRVHYIIRQFRRHLERESLGAAAPALQ